MEKCCDAHDICYATCNKDKELCDLDFKRCLYNYCETHDKTTVGSLVAKGCKAAAKMLFTGTLTLGCRSYLDSQERACYCPAHTSQGNDRNKKQKSKYYNGKNGDNNYNKDQTPPQYGWKDKNEI